LVRKNIDFCDATRYCIVNTNSEIRAMTAQHIYTKARSLTMFRR